MERSCVSCAVALLVCVLAALLPGTQADPARSALAPTSKNAYVTLLYGDDFLLGVRVLGQSLRDSGTEQDMVVIAAGQISEHATRTLEMDGWQVYHADTVENPNTRDDAKYPPRFWAVYTKLNVFNMVQYEKVVFLDADTIVVSNMDEAFRCPGFCATLRHSERFNSGVMVITPDASMFDDMVDNIKTLPSYTGGDQGFLNAYFAGFVDSPLFNASNAYNDTNAPASMMLPTRYNADIGLYVLNSNRWALGGDLKVVHYTLGGFKPWDWWCGWLVEEQTRWNKYRMRLGPDARGLTHGLSRTQVFAQSYMLLLPPAVLALTARFLARGWPSLLGPAALCVPFTVPPHLMRVAPVLAGYASLLTGLGVAFSIIPAAVTPSWGWILVYEYTLALFALFFGKFLHLAWRSARTHASLPLTGKDTLGSRAQAQPWGVTVVTGGLITTILLVTPFIGPILGITGFVPRIMATILAAMLANTALTLLFSYAGDAWAGAAT